jgi:hypothetical protein
VKTDAEGAAQLQFTPEREGYYRVAWESSQILSGSAKRDRFLPPVKAETYVFVATNASSELGYRHDGVEIIVDKDTFRAGQTAPVMLSTFTERSLCAVQRGCGRFVQLSRDPHQRYGQIDRAAD